MKTLRLTERDVQRLRGFTNQAIMRIAKEIEKADEAGRHEDVNELACVQIEYEALYEKLR